MGHGVNEVLIDIGIIGGGPAGLTAALYAARAGRSTVVFERSVTGGQIALTHLVENYPGFADGVNGFDLAQSMQQQAQKYGAEFRFEPVQRIVPLEAGFRVAAEGGEVIARALIVTAGAEYRRLDVPGEERLTGRGVSYCATCDAAFSRGMEVAVVGGGDAALDEGLFVARYASRVHIIHRRDTLRAGQVLQDRAMANPKIDFTWNTVVEAIEGDTQVQALKLRNVVTGEATRLTVPAVFIFIGHTPSTGLLAGIAPLDKGGHVQVDLMMRTSVPGLFAAGDVRIASARQAVSAAGDGATAAIAADQFLTERYGQPGVVPDLQ
jgi:thioredoxin reductase (NADPH)